MNRPRSWALRDGTFSEGAAIPPDDRGFRYGLSVFETVAIRRERLLFFREHLERLQQAGRTCGFWHEAPESLGGLFDADGSLWSGFPVPAEDGLLRVHVTAGDGGPVDPVTAPRVIVRFEVASFPDANAAARGIRLAPPVSLGSELFPGVKTGNYWARAAALAHAGAAGFDESLVTNAEGLVVSAAMANVFLVCGGELCTPGEADGARGGVVRAWVAMRRPVRERRLHPDDVISADECFLTNSRLGIMPVTEIGGRVLPARALADALAQEYRERVLGD